MFFESTNANIIFFLSISTVILWSGPQRFPPGYSDSLPVAQTRQGLARGENWVSRDGRLYHAFRSIPFAKQPVEGRRFKRPEALDEDDVWDGVADFNREAKPCYQPGLGGFNGREDCLKLSVYTPNTRPESPLPVMVWIHGGGFVVGNSGTISQGPAFLMDHDVIVVSISYRLGILGFLSLETDEAPGNLGMWDQRQALIWVRQNIAGFGGDPDRVTIFGESAGSMSVHYHVLSPQSRGLFSGAIMQSGTAMSPYTNMMRGPGHYARRVADLVGCGKSDNTLACLQKVSVSTLYDHLFAFDECAMRADLGLTFPGPWVPVVDSYTNDPFLPDKPEILHRQKRINQVPLMIGRTDAEGLLWTSRLMTDDQFRSKFVDNWSTCGPINILGKASANITEEDRRFVNNLVTNYNGGAEVSDIQPQHLQDLLTDAFFGLDTHQVARYLVNTGNKSVFKYYFSYTGTSSLCDMFLLPGWKVFFYLVSRIIRLPSLVPALNHGACHADELLYIFEAAPVMNAIPSPEDEAVSRAMVRMWTGFARTGHPGAETGWSPASADRDTEYFVIDTNMRMESVNSVDRLKFWDEYNSS